MRVRLGNLSAIDHHPIHLHGHAFWVVQTEGGVIPQTARWPESTVLVSAGQPRTIDFVADNSGDWAFSCHMTHHVMIQMGHKGRNMLGADAVSLKCAIRPLIPEYADGNDRHGLHDRDADNRWQWSFETDGHGRHAWSFRQMAHTANSIAMNGR